MIFKISDSVRRDRPSENENLFAFYKFLQCQEPCYLKYRNLRRPTSPSLQKIEDNVSKTQKMTSKKIANCFRSALDLLFLKLREAAYMH